jgi:chemosensory pili system protein ChpA (sensor histidine kinase/response regulator)
VQGALTIVGLDGVTQLAEAMEFLLEAMEKAGAAGRRGRGRHSIHALRALTDLRHYLDDLISGQPNQPLRLLTALP